MHETFVAESTDSASDVRAMGFARAGPLEQAEPSADARGDGAKDEGGAAGADAECEGGAACEGEDDAHGPTLLVSPNWTAGFCPADGRPVNLGITCAVRDGAAPQPGVAVRHG